MTRDETTQPGCEVSKDNWERFRQDVRNRKGTVRGHLGPELDRAIEAYLDASHGGDTDDILRRIEEKIDDISETTDTLSEPEGKNKKDRNVGTKTLNRLEQIQEQIKRESGSGPKTHEAIVRQAIEDNAGHSDPTIRRYREMLTDRQIVYPHPVEENQYYTDPVDFVQATNAMTKGGRIPQDVYDDIVDTYGEDWWKDRLKESEENEVDTHDRTFQ